MTVLCLSVVLGALFITVLNSQTANPVTMGDKTSNQVNSTPS